MTIDSFDYWVKKKKTYKQGAKFDISGDIVQSDKVQNYYQFFIGDKVLRVMF
jgi:hypothetical protein